MSGRIPGYVTCPSCWETIEISVDPSAGRQEYIEDCSVCCRPMIIEIEALGDDEFNVSARPEYE